MSVNTLSTFPSPISAEPPPSLRKAPKEGHIKNNKKNVSSCTAGFEQLSEVPAQYMEEGSLDSSGNLQKINYVDQEGETVTHSFAGEAPLIGGSDKQDSAQAPLVLTKEVDEIKHYCEDSNSELWSSFKGSEAEKGAVQTQLTEIFNIVHESIEYINKSATQESNTSEVSLQEQDVELIGKIETRVEKLSNTIKVMSRSKALPSTLMRRLNLIVGMVSFIARLLRLNMTRAMSPLALSTSRVAAEKRFAGRLLQIKSKTLMRGAIDLLKQDLLKVKVPLGKMPVRPNAEGGGGGDDSGGGAPSGGGDDESEQGLYKDARASHSSTEDEPERGESTSMLTAEQRKELIFKQEQIFQQKALSLRVGLIEILNQAKVQEAPKHSGQILLFLIEESLQASDKTYGDALQNLAGEMLLFNSITSFLNERGEVYWDSLDKLKSLYLEEKMGLPEIEENLRKYVEITDDESKLSPEEVLKAGQI